MTKIFAKESCVACGSVLVPPEAISGIQIPPGAAYICLKCGRPYHWVGHPPRLTLLAEVKRPEEDEDDS